MPRKPSHSSHFLLLWLVVLPLLLLSFFAVRGLMAQERLEIAREGERASLQAREVARRLSESFSQKIITIPAYADPPAPGTSSPLDEVLDGSDISALLKLRDNPEAGLSPAGLPRRVLASLRAMDLDPASQSPENIGRLVVFECPSVLTQMTLGRLEKIYRPALKSSAEAADLAWTFGQTARELIRSRPSGGWVKTHDDWWWVKADANGLTFLPGASYAAGGPSIEPPGLTTVLSTGNALPRSPEAPLLFAVASIDAPPGLRVEVSIVSLDDLTAGLRRQEFWTLSSLGGAVLISLIALYLINRTLSRERKLSDMKGQFVASVSHELRSPVASIRLMAEALDAGKADAAAAAEFHRLIAREGARLSTLVGNVLDHARIEQGRRIWNMAPCALADLAADAVRVMEPLARERKVELLLEAQEIDSAVDAGAIQQALVNLLDNAIKFSPSGGRVEVTLKNDEKSSSWEIRVRDEGPGVPPAERERIFERFYRIGNELRRETQGAGIGLSLVRSIAEAHRGAAFVESAPGGGSIFILRIPLS